MGQPINKKWFGASGSHARIKINGIKFSDGTTATDGYIIKQTGAESYLVRDTGDTHPAEEVFLANATSTSNLLPGQCFILATPYGKSPVPVKKIQRFRITVYNTDGSVGSFVWSDSTASSSSQADLIQTVPIIIGNYALTMTDYFLEDYVA